MDGVDGVVPRVIKLKYSFIFLNFLEEQTYIYIYIYVYVLLLGGDSFHFSFKGQQKENHYFSVPLFVGSINSFWVTKAPDPGSPTFPCHVELVHFFCAPWLSFGFFERPRFPDVLDASYKPLEPAQSATLRDPKTPSLMSPTCASQEFPVDKQYVS